MKKRTVFSKYCFILTALSTALLCGVFFYIFKEADHDRRFYLICALYICLFLALLLYMPLSISVDDKNLNINRSLLVKSIPFADIDSVMLCQPTMGAKRIFGIGGWFGWYGWFSERDLGKYFAYYGKASDCFLVTLKNGRKYMLGCKDPEEMVKYIVDRIAE